MRPIKYASDNIVEILGPVNNVTGMSVLSALECKGRLFYDDTDTRLRTSVTGGLSLPVTASRRWAVGRRAMVWANAQVWVDLGLVTAVDHTTGTLTVTSPVSLPCAANARVSAALGTGAQHEFAMSYFQGAQTPVPGRLDYGFRGIIPDDQVGLFIGAPIRIEIDLSVALDARLNEVIHTVVVGGA